MPHVYTLGFYWLIVHVSIQDRSFQKLDLRMDLRLIFSWLAVGGSAAPHSNYDVETIRVFTF